MINKPGVQLISGTSGLINPADAVTVYFGLGPNMSSANIQHYLIHRAGVITDLYLQVSNIGTLGTGETSTVSIEVNGVATSAITTVTTNAATATHSTNSLSIAVVAGDAIRIQWVTPTWATNPTNIIMGAVLVIQI